jgi:[NiFe] hydrogenase diaphorase moiety large subunit
VLLRQYLNQVLEGKASKDDLVKMEDLARTVKATSRCGLGQTSPNPVLETLAKFGAIYEELLAAGEQDFQPSFDLKAAVTQAEKIAGRESLH